MSPAKPLTPAMEDYLEAIVSQADERGFARVHDIADSVGVTQPTVTGALRHLAEMGLVNYKPYEVITLTRKGLAAARKVRRRHGLLVRFFREVLDLPPETADADACRVEHDLSRETVERLLDFMELLETCPRAGAGWLERFADRCKGGPEAATCTACIEECLRGVRDRRSASSRPARPEPVEGRDREGNRP